MIRLNSHLTLYEYCAKHFFVQKTVIFADNTGDCFFCY